MESSRRAVESYWRSRMIDAATSDEDKITPVYKLEEICELLRSSHVGIVKEVSEFVLKRLEHKSPIVKQKALRLIKYSVGKSGPEFRREMQRHSVAVRQLLHHKGYPDPLKGDALNKTVRETAQEALSAIFSTEENKPTPSEELNRRIEGFGNTNYEIPSEEKKSFLSEVVGIGSASIKQGLSTLTQGNSIKKNEIGSYRSPNLRRSLTNDTDFSDKYESMEYHGGSHGSSVGSKNSISGTWGQDSRTSTVETINGDSNSGYGESKTREERLLATIVTSGGVRLQPTRDAIQVFLVEASKVDPLALCHALELKLQSPMWQVRMKAVCILDAILRKDDEHFSVFISYFAENRDILVKCSESPQASLREKATKVLNLLGGEQSGMSVSHSDKPAKTESRTVIEMPDLIDTGDPVDFFGIEDSEKVPIDQNNGDPAPAATPLIVDLFGDGLGACEQKLDEDPFADVSFHTNVSKEQATESSDLFAGMNVGDDVISTAKNGGPDFFDIFGSTSDIAPQKQENNVNDINNTMAGLSLGNDLGKQKGTSTVEFPETIFSNTISNLQGGLDSRTVAIGTNAMFPMGQILYPAQPGVTFNQGYPSQPINYAAMGTFLAQQQFLAAMSNFQHLGGLNPQKAPMSYTSGTVGGFSSPLPDVFHANMPIQTSTTMLNNSKEETKAFDFISDHLEAARDPKRK
ncbi:MODIFIED TRANSPORT TO THE VACUOLE 1-like protein [Drosera capensis]